MCGKIADLISQLLSQARIRLLTMKLANLVLKLSIWSQFHP